MKPWTKILVAMAGVGLLAAPVVVGVLAAPRLLAQSQAVPQWQAAAGGKAEFEVASVKQNVSADPPHSNVGLTNLDEASPNGGLLAAVKFSLAVYIQFAYKLTPSQEQLIVPQLPKWAASERFDIQARAGANATRDQMRLMMQALLADRFKLVVHTETRQLPIFGLVLDKPGKTGPQLTKLADDVPCAVSSASAPVAPKQDGWFAPCAGLGLLIVSGRAHVAASNMTMGEIANHLQVTSMPALDRPVFDQTGLNGKFDFRIEFTPVLNGPAPGPNFQPDESGPTFMEALKEQLGLKLVPQTGPVEVLVVDHVEEPSEN